MRFMMIVKGPEKAGFPPKPLMDAIGQLSEEAARDGTMVSMGGLTGSDTAARVRIRNGKVTVTDGPFTEAKELIGGFAIFNFKTREEAVDNAVKFMDLHRKHWPGWEGETEVREMMDGPPGQ